MRELIDGGATVHLPGGNHEGGGYLSAFLNELVAGSGRTARGARRLMGIGEEESLVELPTERQRRERAAQAEVVMTSSGSLGHVYFAQVPEQLSLEQIADMYPGLIEALVAHEGIGFVVLRSETRGVMMLDKHGARELEAEDAVQGDDPLAGFISHTGAFLRRLARYTNAGDIIVNGAYDPSSGQVIGIDDLVGAHGGVGGMQTEPFIVYPSDWTAREPGLVGAASVHRFLRRYAIDEDVPPDDGALGPGATASEDGRRDERYAKHARPGS